MFPFQATPYPLKLVEPLPGTRLSVQFTPSMLLITETGKPPPTATMVVFPSHAIAIGRVENGRFLDVHVMPSVEVKYVSKLLHAIQPVPYQATHVTFVVFTWVHEMPSVDLYRPLAPQPTHTDPFQAMDANGLVGTGKTLPLAGVVVASDAY